MPRIAIPNKGRLADETLELFRNAGLDVRTRGERALTASLGGRFEAIFVRAADIPEFVADGVADLGITGRDLMLESGRDVDDVLDLEFGECRLVIAATEESGIRAVSDLRPDSRVATAFPRLTADYFARAELPVQLVPISGAAEIAPHIGVAEVIVDLVSSGSTLRVNGLREVERAKGQRYLMANVPRTLLGEIRSLLPGINGPTVIDILNGGDHVAVHAVVAAASIYGAVDGLRAIGATGILVTRIERLIP
jgi:ATP phosphoribosyltransferase